MKKYINFILYIVLFVPPLIFFTDLTRNPYYFQIVLVNALTLLLFSYWFYGEGVKNKRLLVYRTPLDLPMWSFFAAATLSWLVSIAFNYSHPYLVYGVYSEGLKRWLFLLVNCIMVYYAAVIFVDDENRPRFYNTIILAGFVASVYAILQYFGIELIWPKVLNPFGGRSVSTFGNPNFLSSYLIMVMPLIYTGYLQAQKPSGRFFYISLLMTYFAALLCTLTRSSWLGLAVAMTFVVFAVWKYEPLSFKEKKKVLFLPFIFFLALMVFWPKSRVSGYGPSVVERLTESAKVETTYYAPWHQRRLIWSCAWFMVKENPVLGKGWGCFELFYPSYQGRHLFLPVYRDFRTHANNTHNEILEIWSQSGTIGFAIYIWMLAALSVSAFSLMKNLKGQKRYLAIGLFASLAGMWTDNLLNVSLHFAIPAFLFWWNMGILSGLEKNRLSVYEFKNRYTSALSWALIILAAAAAYRYSNNFLGEMNYFKGFKASKTASVQAAIPYLERAHSLQRFEVNNNYELANAYARTNQRDKALFAYKEALRANAGYDEIYFNMATVLAQKGDIKDAIEEYTRSLYINPLSAESYNALGSIFLQTPEKYAKAGIELFKQCVRIFPRNKDIWNNLGFFYTRTNDNQGAVDAYKKALEIDPDFDLAKRNVKVSLGRLGKRDNFLEQSDELFSRVEKYITEKDWKRALSTCEQLVKMFPGSFKARFYLANVRFTIGDLAEAELQYNEALKIEPQNPAVWGNLGLLYSESKQYAQARKAFLKVLEINPNNELAKEKLQQLNSMSK